MRTMLPALSPARLGMLVGRARDDAGAKRRMPVRWRGHAWYSPAISFQLSYNEGVRDSAEKAASSAERKTICPK